MREIGIMMQRIMSTMAQGLNLQYPKASDTMGSYNKMTAKLCPLGFPKSVGQNHYQFSIRWSYQRGRDCWRACFRIAMM